MEVAKEEHANGSAKRAKRLLAGLICCGANHTLVGKDYYRCARNRARGTRSNAITARARIVEETALSALQSLRLPPDLVALFADEFNPEVGRLTRTRDHSDLDSRRRTGRSSRIQRW